MKDKHDIASLRTDYHAKPLRRGDLHIDPFAQFDAWMDEAIRSNVLEPNAMTLSTVSVDGMPSSRIVLFKGMIDGAFSFYTNLTSRKAREMEASPMVALLFFWKELARQVRLEGPCSPVDRATAERYFQSRPRASQVSAWASRQSDVVIDRPSLEERRAEVERRFEGHTVLPVPPFWGGYIVRPGAFEFWQGRVNRFHDRFRYRRTDDAWIIERLAP